jgi:hypothetical protein
VREAGVKIVCRAQQRGEPIAPLAAREMITRSHLPMILPTK